MKTIVKTTAWILLGCMVLSSATYADIDERLEPTAEMIEKQEAMDAYHAARLEAKKERRREELKQRGIDPDTIEDPTLRELLE